MRGHYRGTTLAVLLVLAVAAPGPALAAAPRLSLAARCTVVRNHLGARCKRTAGWIATKRQQTRAWVDADPSRKWRVPLVAAAGVGVLAFAYGAAPMISTAVGGALAKAVGVSAAKAIGAGLAGAASSGLSSLWAHGVPMALRIDPFHPRQLATDAGMTAGFDLLGMAQANLVKQAATAVTGVGGPAAQVLFAGSYLVGYEMLKHHIENRIRNRVASPTDPKHFWRVPQQDAARGARPIWKNTLTMILATNAHRFLVPGLEDNALAKVAGDALGRPWWDRIINARNPGNEKSVEARLAAQTQARTTSDR